MKTTTIFLLLFLLALNSCAQVPVSHPVVPSSGSVSDDNEFIEGLASSSSLVVNVPAKRSYRITKPIKFTNKHVIAEGCQFILSADGGGNSGRISVVGGSLNGGEFYTDAPAEIGGKLDGSAVLNLNNSTAVSCTIYSQLNYCIRSTGKSIIDSCRLFGGGYRSLEIEGDFSGTSIADNVILNSGARYINRKVYSIEKNEGIGVHLSSTTAIDRVELRDNDLEYNGHSGIWAEAMKSAITHFIVSGNRISNSGKCLSENGTAIHNNESGTCIEIIGCPGAEVDSNVTSGPLGYNIAVARGSHRAQVFKNICRGISEDPAVYIGFADDVLIKSNEISGGTFGVSVGESGPANRCKVVDNDIHDNTYAPLLFNSGSNLKIDGNTIQQYVFSAAYEGKGPVKHRDVCRIGARADSVFSTGNTFTGNFNALYTPMGGPPKTISSKGDKISFPISPH